jgi:hypothetical protein
MVENEIGHKIKVLGSGNGGEFVFKKFDAFLVECFNDKQVRPIHHNKMVLQNVPI